MSRPIITCLVIRALIIAAFLKAQGSLTKLNLPSVGKTKKVDDIECERIAAHANGIVKSIARRTRHVCFYRTFVLATILRKLGFPVVFNVGLRNLTATDDIVRGHCWLSLNGEPYLEETDPLALYPFRLNDSLNKVVYWVRPGGDKNIKRVKKSS